jgi:hypothetical protein
VKPTRWRDRPSGALALTFARLLLVSPITLTGLALCFTIIGIPLGFLAMGIVNAWATRPLRNLPTLNINGNAE